MRAEKSSQEKNLYAIIIGGVLILLVGGWFLFRSFSREDAPEEPSQTNPPSPEEEKANETLLITSQVVRQKVLNYRSPGFFCTRTKRTDCGSDLLE